MEKKIIYEDKNFIVYDVGPKLLDVSFKVSTHELFANDISGVPPPIQGLMKASNLTAEVIKEMMNGNDAWADDIKTIIRKRTKK